MVIDHGKTRFQLPYQLMRAKCGLVPHCDNRNDYHEGQPKGVPESRIVGLDLDLSRDDNFCNEYRCFDRPRTAAIGASSAANHD